ncbi:hypothetical protein [Azospirillum argentinense]|uniref:hypothetical protein n=1 Tax=Azospirillum argentinense TaxID=2970906 RepID=UPI0032DF6883
MAMSGVSNSFASSPELSRGVSKLYAQLREDMQKNGGSVRGGFESAFTSADGLVTVTLSSEALSSYGGKSGDLGLHMKVLTRSGTGPDAATSESNAMSDAIRNVDDVAAHETEIQHNMGKTEFADNRGIGNQALPQMSQTLADKADKLFSAASEESPLKQKRQSSATSNGSIIDMLKARSEDGARLAEHLKKSLDDSKANRSERVNNWVNQPKPGQDNNEIFKPVDLKA